MDFDDVIAALASEPDVTIGTIFRRVGLQVGGRNFAAGSQGRLLLKLPATRVTELVESGVGEPFTRSNGVVLKEWVFIPPGHGDWIALAREARDFAL